jgi:FMN phosphatase YigB (HAD superfamily)
MYTLLEVYPNNKIILTWANEAERNKFGMNNLPYALFTLEHTPEKTDPKYYYTMLDHFWLKKDDVVYFEHNEDAVKSAISVGIDTFHYDKDKKDLKWLKEFLDANLN